MRNLLAVGIFCLPLGLFGCGGEGGEPEQSDASSASGTQPAGASAVRAQVEGRCLDSEDDFCTRAYSIIADWISGRLTDEEFVNRIILLRAYETAGGQEQEQEPSREREIDPTDNDCTPRLRGTTGGTFDYDPAWENQVNARERAVYRGTGRTSTTPAKENIRIYSYDPDGQSYENTFEVLGKLFCEATREPDFHGVTLQQCQDNATGRYACYVGRAEGNVVLFFKEDDVPALLDLYAEMTYSQIREHLTLNTDYDFLGWTLGFRQDPSIPLDGSIPDYSVPKRFDASYTFNACTTQRPEPQHCHISTTVARYHDWN